MNAVSGHKGLDDPVTVGEVVAFVRRYWKLIGGCLIVGATVAAVSTFFMTKIYLAETVVAPASPDGATATLARLAGQLGPLGGLIGDLGLGTGSERKVNWVATLQSRELIRAFIEENALMPVLFDQLWNAETGDWNLQGDEPPPSMNDAVRLFRRDILDVAEDKRTGLLTVEIRWSDPQLTARWANDIVAKANSMIRTRVIEENQRNIAYLEDELEKTDVVERQKIIYRLIESRTGEIMIANGRPEYAFEVLDPAPVPDEEDYAWPRFKLITLLGAFFGGAFGLLLALAVAAGRKARSSD